MKKRAPSSKANPQLPVSKQTAGGVAGAVIGGVVAGPVGAVAGAIAGTMMGNRAAQGKSLVSSGTKSTAQSAVAAVKEKVAGLKRSKSGATGRGRASARKAAPGPKTTTRRKPASGKKSAPAAAGKARAKKAGSKRR